MRSGQSKFRNLLIVRDAGCIITGITPEECDACHIIPYHVSKDNNISNGILLNKLHHKSFDKYIWSINPENNKIIVDPKFTKYSIYQYNGITVHLPIECKRNMATHFKIFMKKYYGITLHKIINYISNNKIHTVPMLRYKLQFNYRVPTDIVDYIIIHNNNIL